MPTSAARQRGGVVDAVAGHRDDPPLACAVAAHDLVLALRQHLGLDLVDAELRSRPPRRSSRLSPVSMTMRSPSRRSGRSASARRRLDRVGDRRPGRPRHRPPRRTSPSGPRPGGGRRPPSTATHRRLGPASRRALPSSDPAAVDRRRRRPCRSRTSKSLGSREAPGLAPWRRRRWPRPAGARSPAPGSPRAAGARSVDPLRRLDGDDLGLALGQRAGLVDDEGVHLARSAPGLRRS